MTKYYASIASCEVEGVKADKIISSGFKYNLDPVPPLAITEEKLQTYNHLDYSRIIAENNEAMVQNYSVLSTTDKYKYLREQQALVVLVSFNDKASNHKTSIQEMKPFTSLINQPIPRNFFEGIFHVKSLQTEAFCRIIEATKTLYSGRRGTVKEIVYTFDNRGCYLPDQTAAFGNDTHCRLIIKPHTFELKISDEVLRRSSCEGYEIEASRSGEVRFFDEEHNLLAATDGTDADFAQVNFTWTQNRLCLEFGHVETVDHYPNCDGESDRWGTAWVSEYKVCLDTLTHQIETA